MKLSKFIPTFIIYTTTTHHYNITITIITITSSNPIWYPSKFNKFSWFFLSSDAACWLLLVHPNDPGVTTQRIHGCTHFFEYTILAPHQFFLVFFIAVVAVPSRIGLVLVWKFRGARVTSAYKTRIQIYPLGHHFRVIKALISINKNFL